MKQNESQYRATDRSTISRDNNASNVKRVEKVTIAIKDVRKLKNYENNHYCYEALLL